MPPSPSCHPGEPVLDLLLTRHALAAAAAAGRSADAADFEGDGFKVVGVVPLDPHPDALGDDTLRSMRLACRCACLRVNAVMSHACQAAEACFVRCAVLADSRPVSAKVLPGPESSK